MKLKHDKSRTAQSIQQEYADVCTKLGQAIFAEAEAIREQDRLKNRQEELAESFKLAAAREQASAAAKARAEANNKSNGAEDKSKEPAVDETPPTP